MWVKTVYETIIYYQIDLYNLSNFSVSNLSWNHTKYVFLLKATCLTEDLSVRSDIQVMHEVNRTIASKKRHHKLTCKSRPPLLSINERVEKMRKLYCLNAEPCVTSDPGEVDDTEDLIQWANNLSDGLFHDDCSAS